MQLIPLPRTLGVGVAALLGTSPLACAVPCDDDGLAQGDCPTQEAETETATATETETDTATVTATGGISGSAGMASDGLDESGSPTDPTVASAEGGGACPDLDVQLAPQTPTIQLVVDQSGSMDDDFGGVSRWDAIGNTLVDPMNGVVTTLQSTIRFGISLYTGSEGTCPNIQEIAPQLDASDEIGMLLAASAPTAETPTGESLEAVLQTVLADPWEGEKFIVLATDGEPDTCEIPNPTDEADIDVARTTAVEAVQAAYEAGIRTFVVSVGDAISEDHLQDLANAGVGNDGNNPDAPFYQALDQQSLVDAFDAIVSGVRECKFDLDAPLLASQAPLCDVTVNASSIPYDDPNGWRLDGETAIELTGDACTNIQQGFVSIEMTCMCEMR